MTVFEDVFSDAQMKMVSAALDYVSGQADGIYIHFSSLGGILHVGVFYTRSGQTYLNHQLPGVDTSINRQQTLLRSCVDSLKKINAAGAEFNREVPVEGYLCYRVGGAVDARYSYNDIPAGEDPQWSEKLGAWMQSVQQDLDKA